MDTDTADRQLAERGFSSVQFILASGLALVLFMTFANLVVVQYGRGAIQSALNQGARAGSLTGSVEECEATAAKVVGQLLGGRLGDGVKVACASSARLVVASGSATFESWTPLTPDFTVSLVGHAVIERAP